MTYHSIRALVAVVLSLLDCSRLAAQIPLGGYAPKKVKHLTVAPEPPGGLYPFRKGQLWGYSDTLGNLVIKPTFRREPGAFIFGFGVLTPDRDSLTLINARGEVIRATRSRALGLRPDGSLYLMRRRGYGFRPALAGLRYPRGSRTPVRDTLWLAPTGEDDLERLSPTRAARYKPSLLPGKLALLNPEYERGALIDERGKALTGYVYADIKPFVNGFARAAHFRSERLVLLDRQGREVLPRPQSGRTALRVSNLYDNRALVESLQQVGPASFNHVLELVDSTGRVLRAFPSLNNGRWVISGRVFAAEEVNGPGRLYDRDGQPLLGGQAFVNLGDFFNNRLRACTPDGRCGLLDRELRWVVPPRYQELFYMSRGSRTNYPTYREDIYHDTAYVLVREQGKYGLLRCRDGQVAVPTRYDTVTTLLMRGFATFRRGGRSYVVNARGQELTEGAIQGNDYMYIECRDGLCWAPVRRGDEVALFAASGQQLIPWQPYASRCPLPRYGHRGGSVVFDCSIPPGGYTAAHAINQAGQVLTPVYDNILVLPGFYVMKPVRSNTASLFDAELQLVLADVLVGRPLYGEWVTAGPYMLHPSGRRVRLPEPLGQHFNGGAYLPWEPFAYGVWRLTWNYRRTATGSYLGGYITLSGRCLWEE